MKKAQDPDRVRDERVEELQEDFDEGVDEVVINNDPNKPACPKCGWHNTRLSHTTTPVDVVLKVFSVRAFRCRACGNRFRGILRVKKA